MPIKAAEMMVISNSKVFINLQAADPNMLKLTKDKEDYEFQGKRVFKKRARHNYRNFSYCLISFVYLLCYCQVIISACCNPLFVTASDRRRDLNQRDPYIERTKNTRVNSPFNRPNWDEYFMLQAELASFAQTAWQGRQEQ